MMDDLLANPAVQAGVAPFLAVLVVGVPLRNTRGLVLSMAAALLVVVWLTMGLGLEPFTSVRKLVLAGFAAVLLALVLDAVPVSAVVRDSLLAGLAAAAAVWVALRILQQKETGAAVLAGAGAALYAGALVAGVQCATAGAPLRGAAAALALGLGTGAIAVLGASAQLAQIAIAVGAAGGAVIVALLLARPAALSGQVAGPAAVIAGLAGLLAVFTGVLPWFCLLPVLAAPWATRLVPVRAQRPRFLTACYSSIAALVPMLCAVVLAWFTSVSSA